MPKTLTLTTRLTVEQCLARLRQSVQPVPVVQFRRPRRQTFHGRISGNRFKLLVLGPQYLMNNAFMPFFYGRLTATPSGAIVEGRLRRHPFVVVFSALWFGGVAAFVTWLLWAAATGSGTFMVHPALAVFAILLLGAMGAVGMWFMRRAAQPQEQALLRFIGTVLEAA